MKKLFLLMIMGLLTLSSFSQSGTTAYGFRPVMVVPDTSYKFPTVCKIGDLVWVSSTHQMYQLAIGVGIGKNMNWVLASSARYHYPATTTLSDITTTGAATVGTTLSVGTTLTLPGGTTVTKTSGNANSATTSGSLVVGGDDTLTTTRLAASHVAATTATVTGLLTASVLPTFTLAAGSLTLTTPNAADTVGVAVAGLTTNAIVHVAPAVFYGTDTIPYVHTLRTGWLTLGVKYNKKTNYWIPKK